MSCELEKALCKVGTAFPTAGVRSSFPQLCKSLSRWYLSKAALAQRVGLLLSPAAGVVRGLHPPLLRNNAGAAALSVALRGFPFGPGDTEQILGTEAASCLNATSVL